MVFKGQAMKYWNVSCYVHLSSGLFLAINEHVLKAVWAIINERVPSVNIHTLNPSLDGSNYRMSGGEASWTYFFHTPRILWTDTQTGEDLPQNIAKDTPDSGIAYFNLIGYFDLINSLALLWSTKRDKFLHRFIYCCEGKLYPCYTEYQTGRPAQEHLN